MASNLGEVIERQVVITDATGVPVNADSTPTWAVTLPDGTAGTPPAVANLSTGIYYVRYLTTAVGNHSDLWTAVVSGQTVRFSGSFRVRENVAPIIPLEEARAFLGLGRDPLRDEELLGVIDAAAARIERRSGYKYRRRSVTETYDCTPTDRLVLRSQPVISITSVTDDGRTLLASDYRVDDFAGILRSECGWFLGPIVITYVAGTGVVPDDVLECAREIIRILWAQRSGATGTPRRTSGFDAPGRTIEAILAQLSDQGPVIA